MTNDYFKMHEPKKEFKKKTEYRWTELKLKHDNGGKRTFETIKQAPDEQSDLAPLYSSFAKDRIFRPPVSVKDVIKSGGDKGEGRVEEKVVKGKNEPDIKDVGTEKRGVEGTERRTREGTEMRRMSRE